MTRSRLGSAGARLRRIPVAVPEGYCYRVTGAGGRVWIAYGPNGGGRYDWELSPEQAKKLGQALIDHAVGQEGQAKRAVRKQ